MSAFRSVLSLIHKYSKLTRVQAGGALVDVAAKSLLLRKLEGSSFSDDETISAMVDAFESKVGLV